MREELDDDGVRRINAMIIARKMLEQAKNGDVAQVARSFDTPEL
jgi:hypothetical protein